MIVLKIEAAGELELPREVELAYRVSSSPAASMGDSSRPRTAQLDRVAKVRGSARTEARRRRVVVFDRQQPAGFAERIIRSRAEILIGVMNHRRLRKEAVNVRIDQAAVRAR